MLIGPDEAGAFTDAYKNLRGKGNVVFYNMDGKTADQMKADLKRIRDEHGVDTNGDGVKEYDTHILAHGFQGKDGKEGGIQVGEDARGKAIVAKYSGVLSALPQGAKVIVNAACEGGSIKHSAQYAPEGALVVSLASESTVGWSDNIRKAYEGHGTYISAEGVYAHGVDAINTRQIAARNVDAENWTKKDDQGRTVYAYRSIIRGTNGKQIFSDRADNLLSNAVGMGRRNKDGEIVAGNNHSIPQLIDNKLDGLDAHSDAAIKALPARLQADAAALYEKIKQGKVDYKDLTGDTQNLAHILTTQLVVEKENARQEREQTQLQSKDGAPLPAAVIDDIKAARPKTPLDIENGGQPKGEPDGHVVKDGRSPEDRQPKGELPPK